MRTAERTRIVRTPGAPGKPAATTPWLAALLTLFVYLAAPTPAHSAEAKEPKVSVPEMKAAILLNLPKYVNWSAHHPDTNAPLVVVILGNDEVADEFSKLIQGRPPAARAIILKRARSAEDCGADCQLVFIGDADKRQTQAALAKLAHRPVLTIGESSEFLDRGGMINLAVKERKIRLQVNLAAARRENLQISARLLAIADVVKADPE
jgi:hypothetical protein